jgi:alkanesulfonate monooxygenase SsuD/methylene tetrahydromethanopterin reductase-like flavin-dependent oxidoreductase (luciferase family)
MARIGVRLDPNPQFTSQDSIDLAVLAEKKGYEMVWAPEGGWRDSPTQLAAYAMATKRVKLGTGILPAFSRTPTLTAMTAASLDMISGHRFVLGLGVGHRGMAEDGHGVAFERPMTRIRETVEIVRRLLKGETLAYKGKVFDMKRGSLGYPHAFPVPIYIAALGPQMLEMAGEVADGALLNWSAPSSIEEALTHVEAGAKRAGRRMEDIDVGCYIRTAVVSDVESVREPLKQQILRYAGMEYYRNFFARTGFADEAQAIGRYLGEGKTEKALESISEEMQRGLAVFGDAEYCKREIEKRWRLGVKLPVVVPFAVGDAKGSYRRTVEAFGG